MLQSISLSLVLPEPLLQREVLLAAGLQTDGQLEVVGLQLLHDVVDRRFRRQDSEHVVVVRRQTLDDHLQVGHILVASAKLGVVVGKSSFGLLKRAEINNKKNIETIES